MLVHRIILSKFKYSKKPQCLALQNVLWSDGAAMKILLTHSHVYSPVCGVSRWCNAITGNPKPTIKKPADNKIRMPKHKAKYVSGTVELKPWKQKTTWKIFKSGRIYLEWCPSAQTYFTIAPEFLVWLFRLQLDHPDLAVLVLQQSHESIFSTSDHIKGDEWTGTYPNWFQAKSRLLYSLDGLPINQHDHSHSKIRLHHQWL